MAKKRRRLPPGAAGLTRYFEESPETKKLKPKHIIGIGIGLIVLQAFLYFFLA